MEDTIVAIIIYVFFFAAFLTMLGEDKKK